MPIWIHQYKITKLSDHPMYGRDTVLKTCDDLQQAIAHAKQMLAKHGDLCVIECRYANGENLAKDFSFDSHIRWASWLNN